MSGLGFIRVHAEVRLRAEGMVIYLADAFGVLRPMLTETGAIDVLPPGTTQAQAIAIMKRWAMRPVLAPAGLGD